MRTDHLAAWLIVSSILVVARAASEPEAETPTLTLRWCDPHFLFRPASPMVARELSRVFEELDVSLRWVEEPGVLGDERAIRVIVVRSEPATWRLPANAMGAVLGRDGPQREVYVFFDAVVRAAGYRTERLKSRWLTAREARDLSRALARVIAHEVIHAVLPALDHAENGLMRPVLDREALLGHDREIDPSVAQAFRAAVGCGNGHAVQSPRLLPCGGFGQP